MKLRIYGKPKRISKNLTKEAMHFYMDCLLGNDTDDIKLHVTFVDGLIKKKNNKGMAWPDVTAFKIAIDSNLAITSSLKILAHEIVHIKQFACRELVYHPTDENLIFWQKEEMEWGTSDMVVYYNSPWEIEANGREVGLYKLFILHLSEIKKRLTDF